MKTFTVISAAAALVAAFSASSVLAQSYGSMSQTSADAMPAQVTASQSTDATTTEGAWVSRTQTTASSATSAGVNASATATAPGAPQVILLDSQSPQAVLVSSPPVPDTPQNRARFGGPESNGGKRTAPAGN